MGDVLTAAHVLESVAATGGLVPRVLLYTPAIRGNPIQEMLYNQLWSRGIAPIGVRDHGDLEAALVAIEVGGQAAIHLHWTNHILRVDDTRESLEHNADEFLRRISALQHAGVRFVWTIHNPLPHDALHPHVHLDFCRRLAAAADVIHLWSDHAVAEITPFYELPLDRVAIVPHPSYIGVYPDYADQLSCRQRLDLGPDDLVVAATGAIHPYKRLELFHAAFQAAARRSSERLRLVVAGEPSSHQETLAMLAAMRGDPTVTVIPRRLNDREMSEVILASDIVGCAYDSPIASGVSMLALSLGRPVIMPDRPVSAILAGAAGVLVDPHDTVTIASKLADLRRDQLVRMRQAARARAEEFPIDKTAAEFADVIERCLA